LCPTLRTGDVVIKGNLSPHKSAPNPPVYPTNPRPKQIADVDFQHLDAAAFKLENGLKRLSKSTCNAHPETGPAALTSALTPPS